MVNSKIDLKRKRKKKLYHQKTRDHLCRLHPREFALLVRIALDPQQLIFLQVRGLRGMARYPHSDPIGRIIK